MDESNSPMQTETAPPRLPSSKTTWKVLASLGLIAVVVTATGAAWRNQVLKDREARRQAALSERRQDVSVTFQEGLRREEYAARLAAAGICGYEEFLEASAEAEGRLYPETYRFFPGTSATDVVLRLTNQFTREMEGNIPTREQIILASIIEREATNASEAPAIAGVYANRLRIGMKLDADPTVQYGKDTLAWEATRSPAFDFWRPILRADYQAVDSPYNTYRNPGLPPTAISNPSITSIRAAQNPEEHDYFYFLHRDGKLLMSRTLAEHSAKQR